MKVKLSPILCYRWFASLSDAVKVSGTAGLFAKLSISPQTPAAGVNRVSRGGKTGKLEPTKLFVSFRIMKDLCTVYIGTPFLSVCILHNCMMKTFNDEYER